MTVFKFVTTITEPVYFRYKDINIGTAGYETSSQREIGELCLIEGIVMVGTKEHEAYTAASAKKAQPAPEEKPKTRKDHKK